jgi:ABC-2 type transport system ATP-binding protein
VPVSGGVDSLAEALRRLEGTDVEILDLGLRRPDLDDVFLTLTGHAAEENGGGTTDDETGTQVPATTGGIR